LVRVTGIDWQSDAAWTQLGTAQPRAYAGTAYDAVQDRLIIFGGETPTSPAPRNDVLVVANASGAGEAPTWITLAPAGEVPPGRVNGAVVYDAPRNRLIVHGGCAGNCSPALQDTWALSNANFSGAWDSTNRQLMIFGGNEAFFGTGRDDVWVMAEDAASGQATWS
jgi:hypothetical protein